MSLAYENDLDDRLEALKPVLDEHEEWFSHVVRRLFYPEIQPAAKEDYKGTEMFERWSGDSKNREFVGGVTLDSISRIHADLHKAADGMVKAVREGGKKPDIAQFDTLCGMSDEFVMHMRRFEKDCFLTDSGIDVVSGLRSAKAMEKDLEREMERRARRGKPLCLVIARIDDYEQIRVKISEKHNRDIIRAAADIIRKCMRSFDDAYRSGEAEFVMALKHSDMSGGTASIARMRELLIETPILVEINGRNMALTMSYCASEPFPGDDLEELFKNMRADLGRYNDESNAAIEYLEKSPLQRFLHGDDV